MNEKNILITGFEPFGGDLDNPSWQSIKNLDNTLLLDGTTQFRINCKQMQVSYNYITKTIPTYYEDEYDLIIHVGQGDQSGVKIETIGRQDGYKIQDNLKEIPRDGHIDRKYKHLDKILTSNVDVQGLCKLLCQKVGNGDKELSRLVPKASDDAGLFCCEFLLTTSLAHCKLVESDCKVLFVHVPRFQLSPMFNPYDITTILLLIVKNATSF